MRCRKRQLCTSYRQLTSTVETEPTKPKQTCSQKNLTDIVRRTHGVRPLTARPHQPGKHQGRNTRTDMNHCSTGKIKIFTKEAPSPNHMGEWGVNQQQPNRAKHTPKLETDPLHQSARNQSGSDDREHALKESKGETWDRKPIPNRRHILQQSKGERIAYNSLKGSPIGKRKAEPKGDPHQSGNPHHHEAHRHRVEDIPRLNKPSIKKCQARRHQQHQSRGRQDQRVVCRQKCRITGIGRKEGSTY